MPDLSSYGFGEAFGSTYYTSPQDIYASSFHAPPHSYMVSGYSITADANGDKLIYEGTVLAMSTYDPSCATPYDANSSTDVIGVLPVRENLRTGMKLLPVQTHDAILREDKCRDNGVYGTVRAGSKTALGLLGITFQTFDN